MDLGLNGKKALVCAASQGIGRAIAYALAAEGAEVFICARDEQQLKNTTSWLNKHSKTPVHARACDLTKESSRQELIDDVQAKFGELDILVHNVGGPKPSSVEGTTSAAWSDGFERLFQSVVHLNHAFVPGMKKKKWGRIIAITSLSVLEPIPGMAVSNSLRSAVTAMLKTLADELGPSNITVNCVAPGAIATDRIEDLIKQRAEKSGRPVDDYRVEYISSIPMGRLGTPDEFAAGVCFLASDQASYITGTTLSIDGGKRRSTY